MCGSFNGSWYLLTAYCPGGDLETLLRQPEARQPAWLALEERVAR